MRKDLYESCRQFLWREQASSLFAAFISIKGVIIVITTCRLHEAGIKAKQVGKRMRERLLYWSKQVGF